MRDTLAGRRNEEVIGLDRHRGVSYRRVSTTGQAEEGLSLDVQFADIELRAVSDRCRLVDDYCDAGLSGRSDDRAALQKLRRDASLGTFDRVYAKSIDRVARNAADFWRFVADLQGCGVTLVLLKENFDSGTPIGRMVLGILASVAELESVAIGERVSATAEARVLRSGTVYGGRYPPYGYMRAAGRLIEDPAEAPILRSRIFGAFVAGQGLRPIARALNLDGVPTKGGKRWAAATLRGILENPVYVGKVRLRGKVYEGSHDPLLEEEVWLQAQQLIRARASTRSKGVGHPTSGSHLLTHGTLRCAVCGRAMLTITRRRPSGKVYETYECSTRKNDGGSSACAMPHVPRAKLDEALLEYFERQALDVEAMRAQISEQLSRRSADEGAALAASEREVARAEERLARVKRDYRDGVIDAAEWREHRTELVAEKNVAAREAEQHRQRAKDVTAEAALLDAEEEMLRYLADIRAAVAGDVTAPVGVDSVRAALLRLFSGFTLHCYAAPRGAADAPGYLEPTLLLPGHGGLYVEPHVRPEAVLDEDKGIAFPQLRQVPLNHAEDKGNNCVQFLSPPAGKEDATADVPFEPAPA